MKSPSNSHPPVRPTLSRRGLLRAAGFAAAAVAAGLPRVDAAVTATTEPAGRRRTHRILTCNILLDLPEQKGTPFDWAARRREACENLIRSRHPDIVCMQEVGRIQNDDMGRAFPDFGKFGYDDPYVDKRPRRFQAIKNVILFSRDRYELVAGGTYWLSETPLVPGSHLPGEGLPRHVTWVRLQDRATGRQFRVLDTHLGLKQPHRQKQAEIIAAETQPYADDFPQLLCGDFNSTATSSEHRVLLDAGWKDTYAAVHGATTTAPATAHSPRKIDFVFYRGAIKPVAAEIFRNADPARPASDHPFVSADVEI
jgi:endonuclease/exonuclease/phosphatase family metal-dependent hydrolase